MQKIFKPALFVVALVLATFLGATAYSGYQARQQLDVLRQSGEIPALTGNGSFQNMRIRNGFFSSSIDADLVISSAGDVQSFPVHLAIDQWPSFGGPLRVRMTLMRPRFGDMHDFLTRMHEKIVLYGLVTKRWIGGATIHARNDGFSGTTAGGVRVKWDGARMDATMQSSRSGDVRVDALPLRLSGPGVQGVLAIDATHLSYGMHDAQQSAGSAYLRLMASGVRMEEPGKNDLSAKRISLDGAASWNVDPNASHPFFRLDKMDLNVDLTRPAGHAQAQAQATLPITRAMLGEVTQQPTLGLLDALRHLDGQLTVATDDAMLKAFPALAQQAREIGAVRHNGLWTVQTIVHDGQVVANGRRLF